SYSGAQGLGRGSEHQIVSLLPLLGQDDLGAVAEMRQNAAVGSDDRVCRKFGANGLEPRGKFFLLFGRAAIQPTEAALETPIRDETTELPRCSGAHHQGRPDQR